MIKFRQKQYTIPEGHYTGPKDALDLPGTLELATKGALAGVGVGAVIGAVTDKVTILDGIKKGSISGAIAGILAKFLVNHIQKPMSSVKYQEVDKAIRKQFGMYRVAGITVGDSIDKRDKLEEKFSFNDRNVSGYKINIAVCNGKFTLYTFGMTKEELDKTSKILDYYCKKYYGMEYDSIAINPRVNSYSVAIIFTNVEAICDFIMELSSKLETKINLLDDKAIVLPRLTEAAEEEETEKTYSVSRLNSFDILNALSTGAFVYTITKEPQEAMIKALVGMAKKAGEGIGTLGFTDNNNLESELKKLHYVEGFHFTVSGKQTGALGKTNMSVIAGNLIITTDKNSEDTKNLEKNFYGKLRGILVRKDNGRVITYIYVIKNRRELDLVLNTLMKCNLKSKVNIYDQTIDQTLKGFIGKFKRK